MLPIESLQSRLAAACCVTVWGALTGCAGPGEYVWFQQLPQETVAEEQRIRHRSRGYCEHSRARPRGDDVRQRVRTDGRLALLLIGDVEAKGKRPSALKAELEGRLKDYIVSPSAVVNVDETQPMTVLLMGEVAHPGAFPLDPDRRLAHALALGGGLTDFASRSAVFVVRDEPKRMRIRFTYESIYRNIAGAADFVLHRGDVVEVE